MEKNLVVFRVLDLPFFVPGLVVLVSLMVGWPGAFQAGAEGGVGEAMKGNVIFAGLLLVFGVYLLGLFCHGVGRILREFILWVRKRLGADDSTLSFQDSYSGATSTTFGELLRTEPTVLQYFWYMRSLCLNLVPALIFATLACGVRVTGWAFLIGLPATGLALYLYRDFQLSYISGAAELSRQAGEEAAPAPAKTK